MCVLIKWSLIIFILGMVRPFIILHYVVVVSGVCIEFVVILIATRSLRELLIKRYSDAKVHEHQPARIIEYYKSGWKQYKFYSSILLVAFCIQLIGFTIYCIHPIVMIIVSYPGTWRSKLIFGVRTGTKIDLQSHPIERMYNLVICSIEELSLALGLTLKVLPSLFVLIYKLFRYVKDQRGVDMHQPHPYISIKSLIDRNNEAYKRKETNK